MGAGKTFLAAGLRADAVNLSKTMEEFTDIQKLKEMTGTAMREYNRLLKADLIILDGVME